ncbi:MAG: nitroreductase family protein [Patescibacteria group bacterium]|nr:nitroreductase family protein [Patescibacteria group bacterium]
MELENLIKTRRSIRNFTNQPVDLELVKKIIELGTHAPSACNIQGWHFIIIKDQKIKDEMIDLGSSIIIKNAPIGILVLYDQRTKNTEYQDHIQSAAAAIQNILLSAHAHNLGACWVCHLPLKEKLKKLFKIEKYLDPIAYIIMGYPQREPYQVKRKYQLEEMISIDKFYRKTPLQSTEKLLTLKKSLYKIYRHTPTWLKKLFFNKLIDKKFVKKFKN